MRADDAATANAPTLHRQRHVRTLPVDRVIFAILCSHDKQGMLAQIDTANAAGRHVRACNATIIGPLRQADQAALTRTGIALCKD
jgi:hypothetical protein